jgi:hypothetical protein
MNLMMLEGTRLDRRYCRQSLEDDNFYEVSEVGSEDSSSDETTGMLRTDRTKDSKYIVE